MKVGLLGGTFDPIHNGALTLCKKICHLFSLDKIYFIPCSKPPHKTRKDISHTFHRYAMVVLATAPYSRFLPSFYEIEKGGKSYTIDTLNHFQRELGKGHEIFFILGTDALSEIDSWKKHDEIMERWHLIVLNRQGCKLSEVRRKLPEKISKKIKIIADRMEHPAYDALGSETDKKIFFAKTGSVPISSSAIRAKVRKKESLRHLVPSRVERYIRKFNLYM